MHVQFCVPLHFRPRTRTVLLSTKVLLNPWCLSIPQSTHILTCHGLLHKRHDQTIYWRRKARLIAPITIFICEGNRDGLGMKGLFWPRCALACVDNCGLLIFSSLFWLKPSYLVCFYWDIMCLWMFFFLPFLLGKMCPIKNLDMITWLEHLCLNY